MRVFITIICLAVVYGKNPRIFFGGHFDSRSVPNFEYYYGVGIWDDEYGYWLPLGGGLSDRTTDFNTSDTMYNQDEIYSSYWDDKNGDLYIGGHFTKIGGVNSPNIVKYTLDNQYWTTLTENTVGKILSIVGFNNKIIVGGDFQSINNVQTGSVAMLDTSTMLWSALGNTIITGTVQSMAIYNNNTLYIVGNISNVGNETAWGFAAYDIDKNEWSIPGSICDGNVTSLTIIKDYLYIAGGFESYSTSKGCTTFTEKGLSLAEYDLINKNFTDRLRYTNQSFVGTVNVISKSSDDELVVIGDYSSINSVSFPGYALFNTTSTDWSTIIPSQFGIPFTGSVYTIASTPGYLFFGGYLVGAYMGVVKLSSNGIWNSLNSGLGCSICPVYADSGESSAGKRVPWIYTISVLSPGTPPPPQASQPPLNGQLVGSNGIWDEYNIPPYPGSNIYFQNDTDYTMSTVGSSRPGSFYWQTWSVICAVIFIGSLFFAVLLNMCVKSVARIY